MKMIEKAYVDTSLLAAYYCPELLSLKAENLLLTIQQPMISPLTEVELLSVISRKVRKKELSKRNAQQIQSTFTSHLNENYYQKISVKPDHYLHACYLLGSFKYSLHSLDALHLAIADSEDLLLITMDKNLAKAAKKCETEVILLAG